MAQTGFTPIQLYSSSTATNVPLAANLATGELAINITDGKLFYKDNAAAVQVIGWKVVPTSAGGTGLTTYTAGDTVYYASGTALTKLAIGTAYQSFQVNAGATAPSWQPSATSTLTAQGDLLYASGANTLARLAKDANATRYLSNTGTTNNPAWAQVNITNGVTGTLPATSGGTGSSSAFTANGIPYASSTSVLSTSADFKYTGTYFGVGSGTTGLGSVEIQTSATTAALWVQTGGTTVSYVVADFRNGGNAPILQALGNNTVYVSSLGTGLVYSNSGILTSTNPSDARLKIDIENLSWGLADILALRPVSYKWKTDEIDQGTQYGFIAQEVQSVMPELIREFESADGTRLGLEKEGIYAAMVKAIQELTARVAELEAK